MSTARFITLEGVEGAGKTTQIEALRARIESAGHPLVVTREPGGTPLGERVRALLLDPGAEMTARAELLLMFAARVEHVERVIAPALAAGTWVLSDRYLDASVAYQGAGRDLGPELVEELARVMALPRPDLTLVLDLPPAAGRARAAARGSVDRFERENDAFHARVRAAYLAAARAAPQRMRVVDASAAPAAVRAALVAQLEPLL